MKLSETFEGDNSSMKKTFEEVVYEATPFSPGVLTVGGPAQKEEVTERPLHISAEALFECSMKTKELIRLAEARGRDEERKRALKQIRCRHDIDGDVCDCCRANFERIDDPDLLVFDNPIKSNAPKV